MQERDKASEAAEPTEEANAGRSVVHDEDSKPDPVISTDLTSQGDATTRLTNNGNGISKRKAKSTHISSESEPTTKRPKNNQDRSAAMSDEVRKPAARDTTSSPTPDDAPSSCPRDLKGKGTSTRTGSVVLTRGQRIKREPVLKTEAAPVPANISTDQAEASIPTEENVTGSPNLNRTFTVRRKAAKRILPWDLPIEEIKLASSPPQPVHIERIERIQAKLVSRNLSTVDLSSVSISTPKIVEPSPIVQGTAHSQVLTEEELNEEKKEQSHHNKLLERKLANGGRVDKAVPYSLSSAIKNGSCPSVQGKAYRKMMRELLTEEEFNEKKKEHRRQKYLEEKLADEASGAPETDSSSPLSIRRAFWKQKQDLTMEEFENGKEDIQHQDRRKLMRERLERYNLTSNNTPAKRKDEEGGRRTSLNYSLASGPIVAFGKMSENHLHHLKDIDRRVGEELCPSKSPVDSAYLNSGSQGTSLGLSTLPDSSSMRLCLSFSHNPFAGVVCDNCEAGFNPRVGTTRGLFRDHRRQHDNNHDLDIKVQKEKVLTQGIALAELHHSLPQDSDRLDLYMKYWSNAFHSIFWCTKAECNTGYVKKESHRVHTVHLVRVNARCLLGVKKPKVFLRETHQTLNELKRLFSISYKEALASLHIQAAAAANPV
jgi:hypothetical protein